MVNLRNIYGPNIPYPINFHRTKWISNQNSFGTNTFYGVKSKSSHTEDFGRSLEDKVFFAGDYTSVEDTGYIHGAYASGIREAKKIINFMKGE